MFITRNDMNLKAVLLLVLAVNVSTVFGAFSSTQICNNCGVGPDCGPPINETEGVTRESLCWDLCDDVENCTLASLNGSSICRLYNCTQIAQNIGGHTYRRTNITDCPEYEIFVNVNFRVSCTPVIQKYGVTRSESCLESCLETNECRGSMYNSSSSSCSCYNTSCPTILYSSGVTSIQRKCFDELPACVRDYKQRCINCRAGVLCKPAYNQVVLTKPLEINTTLIGVDDELEQIWFSHSTANGSSYMYMQCSYVTQSIGDILYRASCSQDCPKFELFTLTGYRGTCSSLGVLTGGVTLEFCMDKCLDMDRCRGVTYNRSCTFHDCDNYTSASGFIFMRRRCINGPDCEPNDTIIQTCIHCLPGPNCPTAYMTNESKPEYTDCYKIKASDRDSILVHYDRNVGRCHRYQCSQVQQGMGNFVYRQSCNTDCPEFELFKLQRHEGTCNILATEEGGLNFAYCIERCLDIPGCRATTFDRQTGRCLYHSCSNYTKTDANTIFMWKRCGVYEVQRDYLQTCVDCIPSWECAQDVQGVSRSTWQQCQQYYMNNTTVQLFVFKVRANACVTFNCTWIQQHNEMFGMTFRKSVTNDCPIYRLFRLKGYAGSCAVIGFEEGNLSEGYCVDKCLDLTGCRAVSYNTHERHCYFHNCTERYENSTFIFIKRICMTVEELNVVKPYTQTCKNCQNMCGSTLSFERNVYVSSECNSTCDECNSIQYNPQFNKCLQYQCDRPYTLGEGTTLMRRTVNPVCRHFEIFEYAQKTPLCSPFEYDEGVEDKSFSLKRYFDLQNCLMLGMDRTSSNCSYFSCTDFDRPNAAHLFDYVAVKSCLHACPISNVIMQTCLNCDKAYLCQSPFQSMTTDDGSICDSWCRAKSQCMAYTYNTSSQLCQYYQCSYVKQRDGSVFYRKSCHADCQTYEIYILDNQVGNCAIIENMTEYNVQFKEICHERCLDTPGCRGVTHSLTNLTCSYHIGDCQTGLPVRGYSFMWKNCLQVSTSSTILPVDSSVTILATQYHVGTTDYNSNTHFSSPTPSELLLTLLATSSTILPTPSSTLSAFSTILSTSSSTLISTTLSTLTDSSPTLSESFSTIIVTPSPTLSNSFSTKLTTQLTTMSDYFSTILPISQSTLSEFVSTLFLTQLSTLSNSFTTIISPEMSTISESFCTSISTQLSELSDSFSTLLSTQLSTTLDSTSTLSVSFSAILSTSSFTFSSTEQSTISDAFATILSTPTSALSDSFSTLSDSFSTIPPTPSLSFPNSFSFTESSTISDPFPTIIFTPTSALSNSFTTLLTTEMSTLSDSTFTLSDSFSTILPTPSSTLPSSFSSIEPSTISNSFSTIILTPTSTLSDSFSTLHPTEISTLSDSTSSTFSNSFSTIISIELSMISDSFPTLPHTSLSAFSESFSTFPPTQISTLSDSTSTLSNSTSTFSDSFSTILPPALSTLSNSFSPIISTPLSTTMDSLFTTQSTLLSALSEDSSLLPTQQSSLSDSTFALSDSISAILPTPSSSLSNSFPTLISTELSTLSDYFSTFLPTQITIVSDSTLALTDIVSKILPTTSPTISASFLTTLSLPLSTLSDSFSTMLPTQVSTFSASSTTTYSITSRVYKPIYLVPCLCSNGTFKNMTNEEIIDQLVQNLTLDAGSLSSTKRKYSCAEDERMSSIAIGTVGVIVLASVASVIVLSDLPNLLKMLRQLRHNLMKMVRKRKPSTPHMPENIQMSAENVHQSNDCERTNDTTLECLDN